MYLVCFPEKTDNCSWIVSAFTFVSLAFSRSWFTENEGFYRTLAMKARLFRGILQCPGSEINVETENAWKEGRWMDSRQDRSVCYFLICWRVWKIYLSIQFVLSTRSSSLKSTSEWKKCSEEKRIRKHLQSTQHQEVSIPIEASVHEWRMCTLPTIGNATSNISVHLSSVNM